MSLIEIDRNPSRSKLLTFGLLLALFVAFIGAILRWRWGLPTASLVVWVVGVAVVAVYFILPALQQSIYLGWMYAVLPIGICVSYIIFAGTYFLIVTPLGFLLRLKHDPLERNFDPKATTYWTPHQCRNNKEYYLRQF